jgi:hypothetical protein
MSLYIISPQPKCKFCGEVMKEWNPFANEHYHIQCIAKHISNKLIVIVKNQNENKHIS